MSSGHPVRCLVPAVHVSNGARELALTQNALVYRRELFIPVGEVLESVRGTPVPVAAVLLVALDLVQHGMQPVGRGVALVALGDCVGFVPLSGSGEIDGAD